MTMLTPDEQRKVIAIGEEVEKARRLIRGAGDSADCELTLWDKLYDDIDRLALFFFGQKNSGEWKDVITSAANAIHADNGLIPWTNGHEIVYLPVDARIVSMVDGQLAIDNSWQEMEIET